MKITIDTDRIKDAVLDANVRKGCKAVGRCYSHLKHKLVAKYQSRRKGSVGLYNASECTSCPNRSENCFFSCEYAMANANKNQ